VVAADDDQRRDRTMEEMGQEAALYRAVPLVVDGTAMGL
jgi:hypothetical protein